MTPNKSINWGNFSMAEWSQKSKNGNFYNTYSLSKNKYDTETNKVVTAGSLGLDKKEHADILLYMLSKAGTTEVVVLNYKLKPILNAEKKIIGQELSKSYTDKEGKEKVNKIDLMGTDIIYLKTVLNTFIRLFVNYYEHQQNNNYCGSSDEDSFADNEQVDQGTDNIPVDDTIPF